MIWPVTDANFDSESFAQFGDKRFLTTPLMKWMWDLYTTDPKQRKEIYASPLQANVEQLKGLPPALIQVAESDYNPSAYERAVNGTKVVRKSYDKTGMTTSAVETTNYETQLTIKVLESHMPEAYRKVGATSIQA